MPAAARRRPPARSAWPAAAARASGERALRAPVRTRGRCGGAETLLTAPLARRGPARLAARALPSGAQPRRSRTAGYSRIGLVWNGRALAVAFGKDRCLVGGITALPPTFFLVRSMTRSALGPKLPFDRGDIGCDGRAGRGRRSPGGPKCGRRRRRGRRPQRHRGTVTRTAATAVAHSRMRATTRARVLARTGRGGERLASWTHRGFAWCARGLRRDVRHVGRRMMLCHRMSRFDRDHRGHGDDRKDGHSLGGGTRTNRAEQAGPATTGSPRACAGPNGARGPVPSEQVLQVREDAPLVTACRHERQPGRRHDRRESAQTHDVALAGADSPRCAPRRA